MKRRPYHVNPALQTWEEKNYLKLMSKKIQAARSTVPKARGKKSSFSDQADATGDTATPILHRPSEGPSKVSVQPSGSGPVPGWLGHDRALPNEQKILADEPLSSYVSPAKQVSSRRSRYGGPIPTEGFPPVATAVPVTIPALPPLPDKAPPLPAAVKPITPDSPDIRPTHMLSPPMQLGFANTSFGHFSRSQIPSCNPAEQALNKGSPCEVVPSCSHGVHAERRDPGQILIRQTEENRRSSGISQAGSHSSQAVPAQGASLPPIPAAHSAGSLPIPKGRVGKGVAHPASKAPGVSSTRGKHSMKSKGSRPNIIVPAGARSKPAPGWNDDFSVQYSDPVSIKDQERHMSKTHQGSAKQSQMPSGHTALQPPGGQSAAAQHKQASSVGSAAGASRVHKPPAVPWTQQGCRPPAAHEPSDQCVDTVYMNDDWECSLQSAQIGCSSVHSRNLDSAQSPLRPLKGEHGSSIGVCGQAELDKASSTSVKGATIKAGQQQSSSGQLPPLLNALVLNQATYMSAPLASSAASFLMRTSSFSPLRNSQLESSSPSHPLFAHTSGQKSHGSIGQNPWAERKAMLTDAEVLNAEAGQQQADRSPISQCSHDSSQVRLVSSNSPVCTAPVKGSWQQAVAQVRSQAASSHAHKADDAWSAPAAQQNRAESSRAHWSKATDDFPEQGNKAVIAQHSPASTFEAASSGKAGGKSGSAVVVAALCITSTSKPSSSFNSAGCSLFASFPTPQMASKASKPTDRFTQRPGSAVDVEDARVAAAAEEEAEAANCHSASSLPMLTDYLARQPLSCRSTDQLSCSNPEEILSALNSTDLAFLAAAKPLQKETDLPGLEPLKHSTSTVAFDSQLIQAKLGSVSRSSCVHVPARTDDDDDDLVLHDSKSEAAVMSYSQPGVSDTSFGKAVCQSGAGCATAEDCTSLDFTSTVLGKQCWLGNAETKVQQQQDHAPSLLNSYASLDSLYADNDWE